MSRAYTLAEKASKVGVFGTSARAEGAALV